MIGALILAGTTLAHMWSAHKAANAAKKAAATQSTSADKAMDFNKMLFGQQQQAFAPYQAAGQGAVTNIGQLLTGARPPSMPASVQRVVGAPQQNYGAMMMNQSPLQGPSQAVGVQSQPQGAGRMVTLMSPDGEMGQVPEAQAQYWIQKKGARPVPESNGMMS